MNPEFEQSDASLLQRFVAERDDAAFSALVGRYAGLVYGVALRRAGHVLADEVAQNVFAIFANKARRIDPEQNVAAWLHKVAVGEAANIVRKELRRQNAMQRYAETLDDDSTGATDLPPELDDALAGLSRNERELIMMRFFEARSFREIGDRLGASEDAGRKRVSRTLEKLASAMRRRGAGRALSAAALATLLGQALSTKAPASTVAACSAAAGSSSGVASAFVASKLAFASTLLLVAAIPVAVQWRAAAVSAPPPKLQPGSIAIPNVADAPVGIAAAAAIELDAGLDLIALAAKLALVRRGGEPADVLFDLKTQMFALEEIDLHAVGELLSSAQNADHLRPVIDAYFARWAEFDLIGALEDTKSERWLTENNEDEERIDYLATGSSADRANRWRSLAGNARLSVLEMWASSDPTGALEWCHSLPADKLGAFSTATVLRRWAVTDPTAALAAALAHPGEREEGFAHILISDWALTDFDAVVDWSLGVEEEKARTRMVGHAFRTYANQSAAIERAKAIDDPLLRSLALNTTFTHWSNDMPVAVRSFLELPEADRSERTARWLLTLASVRQWLRFKSPERLLRDWLEVQEGDAQ